MLKLGKRELRDYQEDGHGKTLTHFRASRDPAVVVASVGAGKSTLIAALATQLKEAIEKANNAKNYKVLILVRQPNIVKDISLELWEMETKHTTILKGKKPRLPSTIICSTEGVTANALETYYAETNVFAIAVDECFHGDTYVTTRNGKFKISDNKLINQEIMCVNEESGAVTYEKPLKVFRSGIKCIAQVNFSSGEVLCTPNHKFYTGQSWVMAKDLTIGQKIVLEDTSKNYLKKIGRAAAAVITELKLCLTHS